MTTTDSPQPVATWADHPAMWDDDTGRTHAVPGHVCSVCSPHLDPLTGRAQIPAPGCEECLEALHLPPPVPDPLEAIRGQLEHIAADVHDQAAQLAGLRQMVMDNRGELGTVRNVVDLRAAGLAEQLAGLAGKLEQLEQEFGPLARKYSSAVARAVASPAARFVAGRARRGEHDNEHG